MKTNWVVAVVFFGAIVVAGLFVHGMTHVSGLAPTRAQATAGAPALTAVRAAESVPAESRPGADPASRDDASQATPPPAAVADGAVANATSLGEATATIAATVAPEVSPGAAAASAAPSRRPTPRADHKHTQEAPATALSAAQRRRAQCRALAAWLQQLETIAGDAGYEEWTRAQRDQARERQAELACSRIPA